MGRRARRREDAPSGADASPAPGAQGKSREGLATWYDVPDESLAKRRAVGNELTAAHNRLPLGTLVRVTHLKNGKSVIVRITDRGITDRKVRLDVCKEAAEQLGMVTKGVARVRMEIVPDEHGVSPAEVPTTARRL
jgi:rare lipoprotein A